MHSVILWNCNSLHLFLVTIKSGVLTNKLSNTACTVCIITGERRSQVRLILAVKRNGNPHDLTWLDSSHIHVNVLGHTPTPFLSVESCHLRLFPGKSHSSQVFLDHASPVCPWPAGSPLETWDFPVYSEEKNTSNQGRINLSGPW